METKGFLKNETLKKVLMGFLGAFLLLVLVAEGMGLVLPRFSLPTEPTQVTQPTETEPAEPTVPLPRPELAVTAPAQPREVVKAPGYVVTGTADPAAPVYINGETAAVREDGTFALRVFLQPGSNTVTVTHKDREQRFLIYYHYSLIQSVSPDADKTYASGAEVPVSVIARQGSTVTASFNGKSVTLEALRTVGTMDDGSGDVLAEYTGSFRLPSGNVTDLGLGSISFTAAYEGITETVASGSILCRHTSAIKTSDPSVTPSGGEYVDVGSGYIAQVVYFTAETFSAATANDQSSPLYNYLPAGTVDYCSNQIVTDSKTGYQFVRLRCGRKVFLKRHDTPDHGDFAIVDCYIGQLPDHNELQVASVVNEGQHTVITLDTLWKAPFLFTLAPQSYTSPYYRDWTVSSVTATYVDIKFCYATVFEGQVDFGTDNPLFSRAEVIPGTADTTLRLHLRKTGGFYGWDASYNEAGQLCFRFLNPAAISDADNTYGADLTGVEILLDIGHGGVDCGSIGADGRTTEAERNLNLAILLKAELESMGATVILNRDADRELTADSRIRHLKQISPDLCIAIHHNGSTGDYVHGYGTYHYNAFSSPAAKFIHRQVADTGIYRQSYLEWHYYFLARQTVCPVVLTENGYITNLQDLAAITDQQANIYKAQAIARGVVDYFRSIQ